MTPETTHRLPGRIAAMMTGTILVFALTLGLSVLWLTQVLDAQARGTTATLAEKALAELRVRAATVALDYAKWDEAARRLEAADLAWLYDNLGTAAVAGVAANLVVLWGGPLEADLGWIDQSPPAGLSGLAGRDTLAMAEARLAGIPLGATEAVSFFAWRGNDLFVISAARIERAVTPAPALADREIGRVLLGHRITGAEIEEVAESALLEEVRLTRARPAGGRMASPLAGGDGLPVAWLSWRPPEPGSATLARMLRVLLPLTGLATALGLAGTVLSRRAARALVAAQARADGMARTDALTGLPNRAAFQEALAGPAAPGERAVLFLDVNGFKRINDSLGHAAGDQVIVRLARRLGSLSGPGRLLARIGGDEFVLVVAGLGAGDRAEELARCAAGLVASPFEIGGQQLRLRAAMGLAVQEAEGTTGPELVRQADLAMYEAKRRRARGPLAFGDVVERAGGEARALEAGLRAALQRPGEIWIAYQPILPAEGGPPVRAEALARWTSAELGPVPPDRFVALAERAGLAVPLGRHILRLVCDDLVRHPGLKASVNLSPIQLLAPGFVSHLTAHLGERGITPNRLSVEIGGGTVLDDPPAVTRRLGELRQAGLTAALDGFGTGLSGIGPLQNMGFDVVKIDRSLVPGLAAAPKRQEFVGALIRFAQALGLGVVGEGVEAAADLEALRELGCDLVQGLWLSPPLPIETLAADWLGAPQGAPAVA